MPRSKGARAWLQQFSESSRRCDVSSGSRWPRRCEGAARGIHAARALTRRLDDLSLRQGGRAGGDGLEAAVNRGVHNRGSPAGALPRLRGPEAHATGSIDCRRRSDGDDRLAPCYVRGNRSDGGDGFGAMLFVWSCVEAVAAHMATVGGASMMRGLVTRRTIHTEVINESQMAWLGDGRRARVVDATCDGGTLRGTGNREWDEGAHIDDATSVGGVVGAV